LPELLSVFSSPMLAVTAVIVAVVAVIHAALRFWIHRRLRAADAAARASAATAVARRWTWRAVRELSAPVAVLLWVQGLAIAARVMLQDVAERPFVPTAQLALDWIDGLAIIAALMWLLARVGRLIDAFLVSIAKRTASTWDDLMLPLAGKAARTALPVLALLIGAPALAPAPLLASMLAQTASLLLIGVVAFLAYQTVDTAAAFILSRYRMDVQDNLQARAVHTQVMVLKKVALTIITIFAGASMLMVFDAARQFGASILASAGVAGIIVGLAAQRSIATLLAGFQIALTQPIRVDDVVIVENEWGRIEEITLTYVVVRIWDLRRLVLPITYFIEHPFQNWTRVSADLLGTVFLRVDYTVPLEALRTELTRILTASRLWDGKVNGLQVTDADARTMEVRALVSAADASLAWDLRCEVREKLIVFLQERYPDALPKVRAAVDANGTRDAAWAGTR
jgi:small-conductance mechanosensitive channel